MKVRDELMDVKVLRETDADGLEQWTPVMKARFPLSAMIQQGFWARCTGRCEEL